MDAYKSHSHPDHREVATNIHGPNSSPEATELVAKTKANENAIATKKARAIQNALDVENYARFNTKLRNHYTKLSTGASASAKALRE